MSDKAYEDTDVCGDPIPACGLYCMFCGAAVTVKNDGTMAHHPEYVCNAWRTMGLHDATMKLQGVYREVSRARMKGEPGWP